EVLEALRADEQRPAVVVLSSFLEEDRVVDAVRSGAISYLPKTTPVDQVVEAVRAAASGDSLMEPRIASMVVRGLHHGNRTDPLSVLSPRERDVLETLSRGRSNREIARRLSLSEDTVKSYVSSILTKLGLHDRTQAAIFGLQHGLVPLDQALTD